MSRKLRLVVFAILAALLPLRGMAAVVADLCGPPHAAGMEQSHECCAADDETAAAPHHSGDESSAEGACSHCAACSFGAPAVPEFESVLPQAVPAARAIPFRDRRAQAFFPEVLDRPPLVL